MARTVRDCAVAYAVLAGEAPAALAAPRRDGLRVGVVPGTPDPERVREIWPDAVEVELPRPRARILPLLLLERALALRDVYPDRRDELGAAAQARLDAAHAVRALDVHDTREALAEWRRRAAAEPAVDVVVTPALGAPVPARPEYGPGLDLGAGLDGGLSRYTLPVGLLGWPALAIGELQITGRDAGAVLGAGLAYEEAFGPPS
jgi:Asp-tRNA(Asn)/Glu-tRNA(Gln) amidotransferase A subunit family amidase